MISYKVLEEVNFKGRHAHLVLKDLNIDAQDQAFVSALVYATLQNSLFLEYQIADLVDDKLPKEVQLVLKMGAAQYFKMDKIPEYALVNETVDLCKKIGKHRYSGVVNAVMKRMIERGEREIKGNALQRASIDFSMPLWILKLLSKQINEEFALSYAEYCSSIKPSYVRVNTLKTYDKAINDYVEVTDNGLVATPSFFKSDFLMEGYALVQDINSQKVVPHLDLVNDLEILDCCCGPGTKTVQIANALENTGKITGIELHDSRSKSTESLLQRSNVTNASIITSDVLDFTSDALYDRILLDAPCSGLGVLSHKHDLRYHILPEHLDDLVILQQQMLEHVKQFLKIDGILVYATCTLNKKENEKQIQKFIENNSNFSMLFEETLNPVETQGDGFYIAKLTRTC